MIPMRIVCGALVLLGLSLGLYAHAQGDTDYIPGRPWTAVIPDPDPTTVQGALDTLAAGGVGGGATELDDLTDVDLTTPPTDGQALVYDDTSSTWQASTIAAGAALTVKEADGTPEVADVGTIVVTNGTLTDDGGGQITLDFGSAATDGSAIHDNEAGEIAAITEKVTPVAADMLLIEDSEASNAKKMVQVGNLPGGTGGTDLSDIKRLVALGM